DFGGGASFFGSPRAGRVYQDLAHQARGDAVEVGAVLVRGMPPAGQPQKRLMDQSRGLEWDGRSLSPQVGRSELFQFVVDERDYRVERLRVSGLHALQQLRQFHELAPDNS